MEKELKKDALRHAVICIDVLCAMYIIPRLVVTFLLPEYKEACSEPLLIAFLFSLVECPLVAYLWCKVAVGHKDFLPTFHTACSGFRMLLALALMLIIYLNVGRGAMLPYFLWIGVFYFVVLVLHSMFFTREANKIFK